MQLPTRSVIERVPRMPPDSVLRSLWRARTSPLEASYPGAVLNPLSGGAATPTGERYIQRNLAIGNATDWAIDPYTVGSNVGVLTPTSGVVYAVLKGFLAGDVVSNIWLLLSTAGAGTPPTGIYLGLISTGNTVLATTANVASSGNWTGAAQPIGFPVSTPYTWPANGAAYLALLQNGTWGTTQAIVKTCNNNAGVLEKSIPPFNATQTGQTTFTTPSAPDLVNNNTFNTVLAIGVS